MDIVTVQVCLFQIAGEGVFHDSAGGDHELEGVIGENVVTYTFKARSMEMNRFIG